MTTPQINPNQVEPRIPQPIGLTVRELLDLQEQIRDLSLSQVDSARLCQLIQGRAFNCMEKEAIGVTQSGAHLYETPPTGFTRILRLHTQPPNNVRVPSRHEAVTYKNFTFVLPTSAVGEHFYVVTHGTLVGVFLHWTRAAPFVVNVKGAVFTKARTLEDGAQLMLDAIDDGLAKYLQGVVLP